MLNSGPSTLLGVSGRDHVAMLLLILFQSSPFRLKKLPKGKWRCVQCNNIRKEKWLQKKRACILLDHEAEHSESEPHCDEIVFPMMTQGSLVDFICESDEEAIDEEAIDEDGNDQCCMRNIYLTSLLPLSQQPEGFGFRAPKYINTGFKLRKIDIWSDSPSSSPNLILPPLTEARMALLTALPHENISTICVPALIVQSLTGGLPKSNRMRLVRKENRTVVLRDPPPSNSVSPPGASNKIEIYYSFIRIPFPFLTFHLSDWLQTLCRFARTGATFGIQFQNLLQRTHTKFGICFQVT